MSDYAGWLNSGSTGPEALGKLWGKLFTSGFALTLTPTAYQVTQRAAGANLSVDIAVGTAMENLTDYFVPVWSSATINKTVTAADPTNPRNDIVVVYINLAAYGANNNSGATQFLIVSGTPAGSPSDPSDSAIQSAVGAGNPWLKLARIALPANAPSVVNAYITDLRTPIAFAGNLWGGSNNSKGHAIPNVADDTVALLAATQTLTGKTIDGGSNTLQNVPASALATNAITLGYAATSSTNQTGITTAVDITGASVTVTVPSGGRRCKIIATLQGFSSVTGDIAGLNIQEGATVLKTGRFYLSSATSTQETLIYSFTPTAGSHTYKLNWGRITGTGTLLIENSVAPADILMQVI